MTDFERHWQEWDALLKEQVEKDGGLTVKSAKLQPESLKFISAEGGLRVAACG